MYFSFADNLAANFSRELADYIIYIIDVSGGDKIPRKGGPGITQADLLVRYYTCQAIQLYFQTDPSCNLLETNTPFFKSKKEYTVFTNLDYPKRRS